ncbi:bis(5'-nucleosyl)-tetraphosphatase (symmetrical) YqeK [Clostridium thermobutyricum]
MLFGKFKSRDEFIKRVKEYLEKNGCEHIYEHSIRVANMAEKLCEKNNISKDYGFISGLLHDIGGIYKNEERVKIANKFKIDLFKEEIDFPMIIHQKISVYLAEHEFGIKNTDILKAIGCHTTFRKNSTKIDMILFLADKIEWDQQGVPEYLSILTKEIDKSLEEATLYYINYIINNNIKVIHPWLLEGKEDLENKIKDV